MQPSYAQTDTSNKALIYARVSSPKQVKEGHGLKSQETRCREFANLKGYEVVEVYGDDVTGKVEGRPGIEELLALLRRHKGKQTYRVLIDDLSRLARDVDVYRSLRKRIRNAGGLLESPSMTFGETSDDEFFENILASAAQYQRQKNAEQVVHRMRARLMNGYFVFRPPPGFKYAPKTGEGNVLVHNEPVASIMKEALEGYAYGRFTTRTEVTKFLDDHPNFPSPPKGLSSWLVCEIMKRAVYAGYVGHEPWNVSLRKGRHEGIISFETYQKIQDKLNGTALAPMRANLGKDFALKGFVTCADCGTPLRACWSKGRNKHYAYYLCQEKGCASYGKSNRRDKVEKEFETLLKSLKPGKTITDLATDMLRDIWEQQRANLGQIKKSLQKDASGIEKQIGQLVDRVMNTDSPALITAYEAKIKELEAQKITLAERAENSGKTQGDFKVRHRTALLLLSNPWILWNSGKFEDRRAVIKLVFSKRIPYSRKSGFRTNIWDDLSLPFKLLGDLHTQRCSMVGGTGIEPVTPTMSTWVNIPSFNAVTVKDCAETTGHKSNVSGKCKTAGGAV